MPKESIVDASVPSAGRIYDYLLGGHHNFEVDRMAAEQVVALLRFFAKLCVCSDGVFRILRMNSPWCRGYDVIIDFASGLPTQDHLAHRRPSGDDGDLFRLRSGRGGVCA